jgi:hypothetical protein
VFEEMPTPEEHGVPFNGWLVPARNNIQRQLLRLQGLVGSPTKAGEELPKFSPRDSMPFIQDLMVGSASHCGERSSKPGKPPIATIMLNERGSL